MNDDTIRALNPETLYATVMSHKEFHEEVVDKYVAFIKKVKHASTSFVNDRLRKYCVKNNIQDDVSIRLKCVKMIDEYVRAEIKLGNK